ncbi:galactarate dehydratase [Mycoplasma sp. P36-A1]|uniref:galactarate dehydratase n=1 Tax=Mycoplasma sp. P36-A1 TaxID=3252900 RepID=UPI003C2DE08C
MNSKEQLSRKLVKVNEKDNVAIAVSEIAAGSDVGLDIVTLNKIPQAHKVALSDITKDQPIIRYGVILGYALEDIKKGQWINEFMLELPTPPAIDELEFGTDLNYDLAKPERTTFEGYKNPNNGYAGTRNILAIHTTVQCVTGVLNVAVEKMKKELLPKYPNVDDILPINHAYGCGVAINAKEAIIPIRTLQNMVYNPNFGMEVMVVALGCEKLTVEMLIEEKYNTPENVLVLQDIEGFEAMIDAMMQMAEKKLKKLNQRKRETLPLKELLIGMQCGGSDAFSGVSANPSAGYASDLLISGGATVMFSEVTEVRDGVQYLASRTINKEVKDKLVSEMKWYDAYLENAAVDRSANPTPGNKKGGLSNIVEKAMGSIAKSGTSPIVEVLSPGQRPTKQGLIYAATPASDIVCGPSQLASGITLQVFMTGRGTPYGLAAAPVIKVSSRNEMKDMWKDLIDVNAGPITTGDATIQEIGTELFNKILDVASGKEQSFTEKYKIHNDLCIFNPAPIT